MSKRMMTLRGWLQSTGNVVRDRSATNWNTFVGVSAAPKCKAAILSEASREIAHTAAAFFHSRQELMTDPEYYAKDVDDLAAEILPILQELTR